MELIPKRDKGKGKAKVINVPDLPETVWQGIFEFVYLSCQEGESRHHFLLPHYTSWLHPSI
jgi:hypothetical protein